ncbi:AtzH-like domain-containing protein [Herbiconiux sp. 11R-BC]|uniref:AtzH-like domain-containing protein n=1 Tax=Herbiconiux sp. 11R-BC TaxID=3111637 RepID=UPI003C129842
MGRHSSGAPLPRQGSVVASVTGPVELDPAEADALLEAFRAYEAALMTNDLAVLDASFAPGAATLRGDANGLLVGHDRISAFRGVRGGVPARTISEVHLRVLSPTAVLVVSVSAFAAGGSGLQTQLWEKVDGGSRWAISAAHVTGAAPALNKAVWRVVGAPLVPALPAAAVAGPDAAAGGGAGSASTGRGPRALEGLTVAVKDLYDVAGFAVGAGIPEYLAEASVATSDADAVHALRAAGAAVQGIAQTDEFAYSIAGRNVHYGTPPNPAVAGAIPGGSSSGPATAVSLGQAAIGLATDTAGSIRVPASYQGLWGIRTTHGAVSTRGLLPLAPSFDTVGWLTRSAAVLRAAAEVSLQDAPGAGFAPMPPLSPGLVTFGSNEPVLAPKTTSPAGEAGEAGEGAQFVVSRELVASCAPEVQRAFLALVEEPVFGSVDEVDLGDLDAVFAAFRTVQGAEAWRADGEWISAHPGVLAPDVAERFDIGAAVTAESEAAGRQALAEARARFDEVLAGRILLLPSASSAAPGVNAPAEEIGAVRAATLRMTSVAGTGGYPAVSAPVLRVPAPGGSAPVGLCLVGPRGSDLALIDLAASLADALLSRP